MNRLDIGLREIVAETDDRQVQRRCQSIDEAIANVEGCGMLPQGEIALSGQPRLASAIRNPGFDGL